YFKQLSGRKHPISNYCGQTNIGSQGGTGTQFPAGSQDTANYFGAVNHQSGADVSAAPSDEKNMEIVDECNYICIPLSMFDESPSSPVEVQNGKINYNLIEGFPSCADIRKRKSYVMSYNTETKNAEWVYEILNKSTLDKKCKENISFGKNELESKDYQQGHLAAAANHTWCQEAYHDTFLMSNMIPQFSALNQGMWKTLENHCRELVEPDCNVHVYTGPLYLKRRNYDYVRVLDPKKLNNSEEKAKPTHLFKVIIVEKNGRVEEPECYVMPNKKSEYNKTTEEEKELDDFIKNIEDIQKLSGLKFKIDKPQHNMIDHIEKITWKGEDGKGESCEVKIEVKILKNP
uniref:Endonuclease n=1 Tax=Sinocyclocheilus grahami TaxID=75366 RepID=A0A672KHZ9_SINGR